MNTTSVFYGEVGLIVDYTFEAGSPACHDVEATGSVGPGCAARVYVDAVRVNGVDILELLRDSVIDHIETECLKEC